MLYVCFWSTNRILDLKNQNRNRNELEPERTGTGQNQSRPKPNRTEPWDFWAFHFVTRMINYFEAKCEDVPVWTLGIAHDFAQISLQTLHPCDGKLVARHEQIDLPRWFYIGNPSVLRPPCGKYTIPCNFPFFNLWEIAWTCIFSAGGGPSTEGCSS